MLKYAAAGIVGAFAIAALFDLTAEDDGQGKGPAELAARAYLAAPPEKARLLVRSSVTACLEEKAGGSLPPGFIDISYVPVNKLFESLGKPKPASTSYIDENQAKRDSEKAVEEKMLKKRVTEFKRSLQHESRQMRKRVDVATTAMKEDRTWIKNCVFSTMATPGSQT